MTKTQRIALIWILLCGGISIFWGYSIEISKPGGMFDFKGVFYGERCLLQYRDPYKLSEPLRIYQEEGGVLPQSKDGLRQNLTWYIYPPTALVFIAPFAILPWGPAHLLWMIISTGSLIFAAFVMQDFGESYAPVISVFLICFVLANSEILIATGNAAAVAVGLCVVSVWCFLSNKFASVGVLCLAISLGVKPHDSGLVWLYFLLVGGVYRKRALQTLALTITFSLPAVLWVSQVSPHWIQELHTNLHAASTHIGNSDPGPTNPNYGSGPEMIIDLQSMISAFRNDPYIYDPISYLVCGVLLLAWSVHTLRLRFSQRAAWLALAAVVPLTMLIGYHRSYDAKLLLMTVPACAMLWAEKSSVRWPALLFTTAAIVFTADIPLIIFAIGTENLILSQTGVLWSLLHGVLMRPTPLILLAMSIFYLWVYIRCEFCEIEDDASQIAYVSNGPI